MRIQADTRQRLPIGKSPKPRASFPFSPALVFHGCRSFRSIARQYRRSNCFAKAARVIQPETDSINDSISINAINNGSLISGAAKQMSVPSAIAS